jgi:hypothetical protein
LHLVLVNFEFLKRRYPMKIAKGNDLHDSPDQSNVVSLLRQGMGPVMEGLNEAKSKVREAKRLHEIAASVGDEQVKAMLGHELRQVEEAARAPRRAA